MVLRLHSLGGLGIDGVELPATARARHRHPLSVLALVAAAAPQALSRDKLMALLWPESDTERASNSLRQTLFWLRRDLGEEVFLPETASGLRLNPASVTADLWDFRAAIERGDAGEAVAVYAGPFLDGFSVPGGADVSHWVEAERERLARGYVTALETLARAAEEDGRYDDAVAWRRRQAAADPFSSRITLGLLRALIAAGDRPGALAHAAVHESLVRLHLESEPDPAVTELVASLRSDRAEPAVAAMPTEPGHASTAVAARTDEPTAPPPPPVTPAAAAPPSGRVRRGDRHLSGTGRSVLSGISVVLLAIVVGRAWLERRPSEAFAGTGYEGGCARDVAEADGYTLVYELPIPEDANYEDGFPPYAVDRSASIGSFDRIAYCLQLDDQWVWVSMGAFTEVAARVGVPVASTGATFHQPVSNMNVYSNVPGVTNGTGISTGNIEFSHHCYDEMMSMSLPGASGTVNDHDDLFPHPRDDYPSCYGSMQVHDHGPRQTVFAYNQWDRNPELNFGPDDLGIGNAPGIHPDWTGEGNARQYATRTLYVLVRESKPASAAGGAALSGR